MATRRQRSQGSSRAGERASSRADLSPSEHAREAVAQWRKALRYAMAALSEREIGRGAKGNGGRKGDAADDRTPIPIQESIEVAVAPKTAYALCRRFDEYPAFLERVHDVEERDDGTLAFDTRVRGTRRRIAIDIVGERANRRIDWESVEGPEHVGTISFHELAPDLTHIELSVDLEPHGLVERLTRSVHLTEHAIRADLHRFKAYAELWQEEESEDEELEAEPEPAKSA